MVITGRQSIGGSSTKLGFDKSKVTCFKCKQKNYFKRECRNSTADETANPIHDAYYRKAVYHRNCEEPPKMKQIEDNPKEKSRALAVIQDDEGFNGMIFFQKKMLLDTLLWHKLKHNQGITEKEVWRREK
ncbi:putative transcription factor interactor and regulator CCHC(Zn) family [Helianthus anomalus]